MTPLERAARALHEALGLDWPYVYDDVAMKELARAVLTAIREPSEEMVKAGEAWRAHCSDVDSLFEEMIDVAIHGPK